jgi:hypothetical protein
MLTRATSKDPSRDFVIAPAKDEARDALRARALQLSEGREADLR